MTKHLFALVAVLAASTLAFGCFESDDGDGNDNTGGTGGTGNNGGTGGGGDLDCSFEPCGGDLVGTWTAYGFCSPGATGLEDFPGCDDAVVEGSPDAEGSITFNADGSYSRDMTISGDIRYEYDDDCVGEMTGGMMNGEGYCQLMQAMTSTPGSPITGTCAYSGGWCRCDLTMDAVDTEPGTYEVTGSTITLDDGTPNPYCVDGNELRASEDNGAVSIFRK